MKFYWMQTRINERMYKHIKQIKFHTFIICTINIFTFYILHTFTQFTLIHKQHIIATALKLFPFYEGLEFIMKKSNKKKKTDNTNKIAIKHFKNHRPARPDQSTKVQSWEMFQLLVFNLCLSVRMYAFKLLCESQTNTLNVLH